MLAAGFVAGSKRPDTPFVHGAVAAAIGYVGVQTLTVLVNLLEGSSLKSPVVYIFNVLLAGSFGVVGALIAERRNARLGSTP
jgi:hypothetical protein